MKPRNKSEEFALRLSNQLCDNYYSRKAQENYIRKNIIRRDLSAGIRGKQIDYFKVVTTFKGYRVDRFYQVRYTIRVQKECTIERIREVFQIWDINGKGVCTALRIGCQMGVNYGSADCFSDWNPMSIRDLAHWQIDCIKRYTELTIIYGARSFSFHPHYETLYKQERDLAIQLFALGSEGKVILDEFWYAIKIARKNKYTITDVAMWADNLRMYAELGKDTHSPKYICQKDIADVNADLKYRAEMKLYTSKMKKYLDIHFADESKGLYAHVLKDIKEFKHQGAMQHNCVFKNKYYSKYSSCILCVTDENGEILATVELDLRTKKILQCLGDHNRVLSNDAEIRSMINSNTYRFAA